MAMTLVSTVVVGTNNPTSIEWTNIPQTGKDLLVLVSARATNFNANITFNNSATGYGYRDLFGDGSLPSTGYGSAMSYLFVTSMYEPKDFNGTNNTINYFGNSSMYIPNYAGSQAKLIGLETAMEFNSAECYTALVHGSWSGTSAIDSIQLKVSASGTFTQYSSASLYIIS